MTCATPSGGVCRDGAALETAIAPGLRRVARA
jgi:hypothetical protein